MTMVAARQTKKVGRDNYPYATARVKARKATLIPKAQYGKFLLMDYLSFLNSDHPHFRGEVETRRNSISKKGNCDFHICRVEEQERCQKSEKE